jgi:hypothetical protein
VVRRDGRQGRDYAQLRQTLRGGPPDTRKLHLAVTALQTDVSVVENLALSERTNNRLPGMGRKSVGPLFRQLQ